jgi:hypothetical protein
MMVDVLDVVVNEQTAGENDGGAVKRARPRSGTLFDARYDKRSRGQPRHDTGG